jgi:predicted lipid carrier protein YhbT
MSITSSSGSFAARADNMKLSRRVAVRLLPKLLVRRFVSEKADGLEAVIELRVNESKGGPELRFTMAIKDNQLAVTRGAAPEARAWLSGGLNDFVLIASGATPWTELLAAGRLELGGDPFTALRVPVLLNF